MFNNIANMFRNTQQVTTPGGTPPQPGGGNNPAASGGRPAPTGKPGSTLDPNAAQNQADPNNPNPNPQAQNSPLDTFKGLWDTDPTKPDPNADPFSQPLFQTDPTKIREAASQIDFLAQVPQDLMAKAMSGSDPQAFMQVINSVAQTALATSLQIGTASQEQAGQRIGQRFNAALPGKMKSYQVQSAPATNPALNHPAVQPVLRSVREAIQRQNPDLHPDQIREMSEKYFTEMMAAAGGGQGNNPGNANGANEQQDDFNWMSWANSNPGQ
jgi:hypothetical protein